MSAPGSIGIRLRLDRGPMWSQADAGGHADECPFGIRPGSDRDRSGSPLGPGWDPVGVQLWLDPDPIEVQLGFQFRHGNVRTQPQY